MRKKVGSETGLLANTSTKVYYLMFFFIYLLFFCLFYFFNAFKVRIKIKNLDFHLLIQVKIIRKYILNSGYFL